jgi:hypothetical protein
MRKRFNERMPSLFGLGDLLIDGRQVSERNVIALQISNSPSGCLLKELAGPLCRNPQVFTYVRK